MNQLLSIFGFLSVLLRGATLAFEALVAGGVLFILICLVDGAPETAAGCRRLIRWSAAALALAQLISIGIDAAILRGTTDLSLIDIATAGFFMAGAASALAAIGCVLFARYFKPANWLMLLPAGVLLAASLMTSHAAARVDHRLPAFLLTALHQGATLAWIGGLPYLLIAAIRNSASPAAARIGERFSRLAQISIAALLLSGAGLTYYYVGSGPGLYGTSYGLMILGKATMFALLLGLGALNFRLVRALQRGEYPFLFRLRRLSEAEIGIGFTVILAAASLTSQAPAIDIQSRITPRQIADRFTPREPRFTSPLPSEIQATKTPAAAPDAYVPGGAPPARGANDIAWSEYNHNWAGVVVLAIGLLAAASRVLGFRWARHWPLAFLGLAAFLVFRADADAWPLGPRGFWSSMLDPEILQHRLFALMIVAFAIFEWGIQVGRIHSRAAALVFPGVSALGGALLLTHSHGLSNFKEEYLAEASHLPIAIFAVTAGWSRWLEQRLDGAWQRLPGMIWPVCFVAIGLMLLFYREA
jgi:putative copper resistance protein D